MGRIQANKSPVLIITALAFGFLIGGCTGWQFSMYIVGTPDADAVEWFRADGAQVMRWSSNTPLGVLSGDMHGEIQAVGYVDRVGIDEERIVRIVSLAHCNHVGFRNCQFNSSGDLARFGKISRLRSIIFVDCGLTDADLPNLVGLTQIEYLYLQDNPITDASVPILAKMAWLRAIVLTRTQLTEQGLAQLQLLMPKTDINTAIP